MKKLDVKIRSGGDFFRRGPRRISARTVHRFCAASPRAPFFGPAPFIASARRSSVPPSACPGAFPGFRRVEIPFLLYLSKIASESAVCGGGSGPCRRFAALPERNRTAPMKKTIAALLLLAATAASAQTPFGRIPPSST